MSTVTTAEQQSSEGLRKQIDILTQDKVEAQQVKYQMGLLETQTKAKQAALDEALEANFRLKKRLEESEKLMQQKDSEL